MLAQQQSYLMVWILVGIAAGIALSVGRLRELGAVLDSLITNLVAYIGNLLATGVSFFDDVAVLSGPLSVVSIAISVAAPGALVAVLVYLARAGVKARRLLAAVLVAGAALSFGFMPVGAALALVAIALAVASVTQLLHGPVLITPLVTLATLTAVRYSSVMLSGQDPVILAATADLISIVPWLDPYPCKLAFLILGVAPFFAAASVLLDLEKKAD